MADLCFLPAVLFGWVFGLSFTIVAVCRTKIVSTSREVESEKMPYDGLRSWERYRRSAGGLRGSWTSGVVGRSLVECTFEMWAIPKAEGSAKISRSPLTKVEVGDVTTRSAEQSRRSDQRGNRCYAAEHHV